MSASHVRKKGPGRPSKPLVTRETAIQTAIEVLDSDGLSHLTVQAVARRLGVQSPSLYYHFRNREELLQLVVRELLQRVGRAEKPDSNWEERAIDLAVGTRRVIMRHANAAPLMLRFFPRSIMLGAYERSLSGCPYAADHHIAILDAMEKLTYGASLFDAAASAHDSAAMPDFDQGRYPLLAQAIAQSAVEGEQLFVETMHTLFDGFRARYRKADTAHA